MPRVASPLAAGNTEKYLPICTLLTRSRINEGIPTANPAASRTLYERFKAAQAVITARIIAAKAFPAEIFNFTPP